MVETRQGEHMLNSIGMFFAADFRTVPTANLTGEEEKKNFSPSSRGDRL